MGKRLAKIGVSNDEENRRQYRQLLFTAGKEAFNNISGLILFHETLYQKDADGVPLIKRAKDNGALNNQQEEAAEEGGWKKKERNKMKRLLKWYVAVTKAS